MLRPRPRAYLQQLLVVTILALPIVACGARPQTSSPSGAIPPLILHVAPGPTITEAHLLTPLMGWVLTDKRLATTTNAGASWTDVTPGGLSAVDIRAAFFLDSSHGWIISTAGLVPSTSASARIYSSHDGGKHWDTGSLTVAVSGFGLGPSYLTFIDPQHGWLVLDEGSHGGSSVAKLYRTVNGGETWTESAIPQSAPVRFADINNGVSAGGPAERGIFISRDGGQTWEDPSGIPIPAPYKAMNPGLPLFVTLADGILPADLFDASNQPAGIGVYVTHDSGHSWSIAATLSNPDSRARPSRSFSAIDLDNWVVALPTIPSGSGISRQLRVTHDRGGTWHEIGGIETVGIDNMTFTSQQAAWAVMNESICKAIHDCIQNTGLFQTTDGGLTWHQLAV